MASQQGLLHVAEARYCHLHVVGDEFDAQVMPTALPGDNSGRAGTHERVENNIPIGGTCHDAGLHERWREDSEGRVPELAERNIPDRPFVAAEWMERALPTPIVPGVITGV